MLGREWANLKVPVEWGTDPWRPNFLYVGGELGIFVIERKRIVVGRGTAVDA
jgi:hypothetical protein